MLKLGEKIKTLRKQKDVSQEVFARYLGVSFQAVSKWETGLTMPDVAMIPAIASFFGVTTDELFDFNVRETEKRVDALVDEARRYRDSDKAKAEKILREGLKQFPGNDVLLNCLLGVLDPSGQGDEIIATAKALAESTEQDEIRFDAYRILAETLAKRGERQAAGEAIEHIPEIYFTKLEVAARLLEGEAAYEAAQKQKVLSAESLVDMLLIAGRYLKTQGETEKALSQFDIAKKVIDAFAGDFTETRWFKAPVSAALQDARKEIEKQTAL